jgi:hypothetical protein
MLIVTECFISPLIDKHGKHYISTEMEEPGIHLNLILSETKTSFVFLIREKFDRKNMQYIKDRTEDCFNDYFQYRRKKKCKMKHVKQWLNLLLTTIIAQ